MIILQTTGWQDYELLDSGNGLRLEKFGKYILIRPDPQVIWQPSLPQEMWAKAHATFQKSSGDKGTWVRHQNVPESWLLKYKEISFSCKLTPFKHTGVFPEQSLQWDFIHEKITTAKRPINVLNLFAYTGVASLVAAGAGAKVTHVDASHPAIGWARENQAASGLAEKPIRWILEDTIKFCQREARRGTKYDGILMDPPIYGHGPKGEKWDFNESFPQLMEICSQLLSDNPLFVIVNAYAISSSSIMLGNVMEDYLGNLNGQIQVGELALEQKNNHRLLSTGIFARWEK